MRSSDKHLRAISHEILWPFNLFENYFSKILFQSPRGQWVNKHVIMSFATMMLQDISGGLWPVRGGWQGVAPGHQLPQHRVISRPAVTPDGAGTWVVTASYGGNVEWATNGSGYWDEYLAMTLLDCAKCCYIYTCEVSHNSWVNQRKNYFSYKFMFYFLISQKSTFSDLTTLL